MIRDRVKSGFYCIRCGGDHPISLCKSGQEVSDAPLETPSHNGEYVGTAQVREIPFGVSGNQEFRTIMPKYRIRAGRVSHRLAVANRLICHHCGKKVPRNSKSHKYCSVKCQRQIGYERLKALRASKRKSKWE